MIYIANILQNIFRKIILYFWQACLPQAGNATKISRDAAKNPGFGYQFIPRKALDGYYIGSMIDIENVAKCR